ncbi:MAG: cytidylate kinase-like family protein [Dorea sp.]|nr:cytidylate kinase-like family protein [Dorea sp.]
MSKRVISINRLFGSNGRNIGKALSDELGIHCYDKDLIQIASNEQGLPYEELLKVDEKCAARQRHPLNEPPQTESQYLFYPMNDILFQTQRDIIRFIAKREECIFIGRCAGQILGEDCLKVFIHAPFEYRVQVTANRMGISEEEACTHVKTTDKERRSYYEYFTEKNWMDMSTYDVCIDSSRFTQEQIIMMLKAAYENKEA